MDREAATKSVMAGASGLALALVLGGAAWRLAHRREHRSFMVIMRPEEEVRSLFADCVGLRKASFFFEPGPHPYSTIVEGRWNASETRLREAMRKAKAWLETGEVPTIEGQPSGRMQLRLRIRGERHEGRLLAG